MPVPKSKDRQAELGFDSGTVSVADQDMATVKSGSIEMSIPSMDIEAREGMKVLHDISGHRRDAFMWSATVVRVTQTGRSSRSLRRRGPRQRSGNEPARGLHREVSVGVSER